MADDKTDPKGVMTHKLTTDLAAARKVVGAFLHDGKTFEQIADIGSFEIDGRPATSEEIREWFEAEKRARD